MSRRGARSSCAAAAAFLAVAALALVTLPGSPAAAANAAADRELWAAGALGVGAGAADGDDGDARGASSSSSSPPPSSPTSSAAAPPLSPPSSSSPFVSTTPVSETVLSPGEESTLNGLIYASASLSLLGALLVCGTFLAWPQTRSFGTKLVFWQSLSDLLCSFSWFPWGRGGSHFLCLMQASMIQFFLLASYLWALSISVALAWLLYRENTDEKSATRTLFPWFHTFAWGYPLISVVLCLFYGRFGPAGSWCWVEDPLDPFRLFVYAPLALVLTVIAVLAVFVRLRVKQMRALQVTGMGHRLLLYLLGFAVSQLPAAVNRVQNYIAPDNPIFFLFVLQAITQPLQGFCNAVVYFPGVFTDVWRGTWRRYTCSCCRRGMARMFPGCCGDEDAALHGRGWHAGAVNADATVPFFSYDSDDPDF